MFGGPLNTPLNGIYCPCSLIYLLPQYITCYAQFPNISPKQKSYKGQNISQYINILHAREHIQLYYQYRLCSFLFIVLI